MEQGEVKALEDLLDKNTESDLRAAFETGRVLGPETTSGTPEDENRPQERIERVAYDVGRVMGDRPNLNEHAETAFTYIKHQLARGHRLKPEDVLAELVRLADIKYHFVEEKDDSDEVVQEDSESPREISRLANAIQARQQEIPDLRGTERLTAAVQREKER